MDIYAQEALYKTLLPHEKIEYSLNGLHADEKMNRLFKCSTLVAATTENIYLCMTDDESYQIRSISYEQIEAIYQRNRVLSGREIIILTKNKRYSISHIEEANLHHFMQFVQSAWKKKSAYRLFQEQESEETGA
ncbi:hypothetical protein D6T70_07025 [Kurthia gibsonii]|uniref:PH domain-containing protein n=1 Tax=Kurthia gibsonii TaxID=33946 RepID=UPI000EAD4DB7|nr:PH domain-containing protein [Kurthia gibsonii]RXH52269.1 hypothetical protein D6T70_07025 [Kurthia gibsonii]